MPSVMRTALALCLLVAAISPQLALAQEVSGSLAIAGNGPEFPVIEKLARTFEKAHPRAYLDVIWENNSKPVDMVKAGQAQIAVTGSEDPDLQGAQIAWDGIVVMVNMSNHTKEVTTQQVAEIFSGKVQLWSDLGGPDTKVLIIDRPRNGNVRDTFERQIGVTGKIASGKVLGPDEKAIKTVVGTLPPQSAVTFISMGPALEAVASGVAVRLLPVDKVEPEKPTVKDGRYKLRRPVLLLSKKTADPLVRAFTAFATSPDGQKIVDEWYTPLLESK
ncbi:MAG: substrate-binding domain-containing protein [Nitrospirae bacterium]|nr:substrate-binding domain-containing protein [Nitrospirota bacterium]